MSYPLDGAGIAEEFFCYLPTRAVGHCDIWPTALRPLNRKG
jgi:hypothetical protein